MHKNHIEEMLKIVVCPKTGKNLIYVEDKNILLNEEDSIYYEIIYGIPVLLEEKAKIVDF